MVYYGCVQVDDCSFVVVVVVCVATARFISSPSYRFSWRFKSCVVVYPLSFIYIVIVFGFVVVVVVVL